MALVSTARAAKELGVAARTLQGWATRGLIKPDLVTQGGHYRWDVERLRIELREKRERDE
jgi:DNA-binding transcriptional MerR regulator